MDSLWQIGIRAIQELETDRGILASGRNELFGCIFGRDSLISSMLLLEAYERTQDAYFITLVRKILINLAKLQGREVNVESGEEPGKMIHEFRPDNHGHLTQDLNHPWHVYPDGIMRNYDTVDATPLFLMTCARYCELAHDPEFFALLDANIRDALGWLLTYGDSNGDGLIDYRFHQDRNGGGLRVQSWMDSHESLFYENSDTIPPYPIAPVEVQAYAHAALICWSDRYEESDPSYARMLRMRADILKERFNELFVLQDESSFTLAYAIDGEGISLTATRSSMGHCIWASGILNEEYIPELVARLMQLDMFVPEAGIRTLSSDSPHYAANSYHNGSIWPHDTALISLGLRNAGYKKEADALRDALLNAYEYFQAPVELFVYDHQLKEYESERGQKACRCQAWSAAALIALLA